MTVHSTAQAYAPRNIRLDAHDNVAIVVNDFGLPANRAFPTASSCAITCRKAIRSRCRYCGRRRHPALRRGDRDRGAADPGREWVDEARIQMPTRRPRRARNRHRRPAPPAPLEGYTFEGFPQPRRLGRHQEHSGDQLPACNASPALWSSRSSASRPSCCRNIPMSTTSSALTHTYGCGVAITAPWRSYRSARCRTSPAIRISAARSWWSASAARNWSPNGCCRRVAADRHRADAG